MEHSASNRRYGCEGSFSAAIKTKFPALYEIHERCRHGTSVINPRQTPEEEAIERMRSDSRKLGQYILSINGSFAQFDEPERRTVLSWIQNIGEQCRHLSDETKDYCRDIPWHFLLTFRHALAHNTHSFVEDEGWALTSKFLENEFPKFFEAILTLEPVSEAQFDDIELERIRQANDGIKYL